MKKEKKKFKDGEVYKYTFATHKNLQGYKREVWIILINEENKYYCKLAWDWGYMYEKKTFVKDKIDENYNKKYSAIQNELKKLYKALNKKKFKSQDSRSLKCAILHINRDISEEQFITQTLF